MSANEIFLTAFDYFKILEVPLFLFTVVALSDEIFLLIKRAIMIADPEDIFESGRYRSRRR